MADPATAFAIDVGEGVDVHLDDSSDDETFVLTVRKEGTEVEKHTGVTAESVSGLASDYFSASTIDHPTPDDDADADG